MRVLTQLETQQWLQKHGHVEDPHVNLDLNKLPSNYSHSQRYSPSAYGTIESFTDQYLSEITPEGDWLLQITVWDVWCDSRGYIIKSLLPTFDEACAYRQMGSFLFNSAERPKAIAIFSLTSCFMWKSYIYGEFDQSVLYNWEGEIFDFWTTSAIKFKQVDKLFKQFNLRPV
jgi:hypothetical protein